MHFTRSREILRDAEVANAIASVVRDRCLSEQDTENVLIELSIPRAANVAAITHRAFPAENNHARSQPGNFPLLTLANTR